MFIAFPHDVCKYTSNQGTLKIFLKFLALTIVYSFFFYRHALTKEVALTCNSSKEQEVVECKISAKYTPRTLTKALFRCCLTMMYPHIIFIPH